MDTQVVMDEVFWQSAYQKHGSALLAYLKVRVPRGAEAEDLLQETFVKAINASERLTDSNKLRPYLFAIAHNLLLNAVRDKREISTIGSDQNTAFDVPADDAAGDPEKQMELQAFRNKLNLVLREMNPKQRQVFELGVIQRMPYKDISKQTGLSLANVKVLVCRARKLAIERLGDLLP